MAGRPTKYTPELLDKAGEYLKVYQSLGHAFPSDLGLSDYLEISTSTLYDWAKDESKQAFSDILDKINTQQQLVAWDKGLKGDYNASLVKLLLGKHGYSEQSTNTLQGGDKPIKTESSITFVGVGSDYSSDQDS